MLATVLAAPASAAEPTDVSIVQLIASPEKFDGKLIRVIGFLRLEFEGDALYLHREDYENGIMEDALWVDVNSEMTEQAKALNMKYVPLEGIFSSSDHGHMGMFQGTITKIRRAQFWSDEAQAKRRGTPLLPPPAPPRE